MTHHAFNFLQLRPLPIKPRNSGLFIGTDQGIPLGAQEDMLQSHGDVIDYAKLADHAGLASRLPESWFRKKLEIYRRYNVDTFIGGISYELAVLQDKVDDYINKVNELGFTGVEISEDAIPPMPPQDRASAILKAKSLGLQVFTEVGRKFPEKPMVANEAIESIQADLELGARTVTIEAAETAVLKDTNPQVVIDIVKAIGLEKIVFECTPPEPWTEVAIWLIRTFGPGVNLENVLIQNCERVYCVRQGMTREIDYDFMTKEGGKAK